MAGVTQPTAMLYLARSVSLPPAAGDTVQMFPPGTQTVTPSRANGDEPQALTLTIDARTAEDLESIRAALQAKADAGEGDAPYFDFNHQDGEASAWPRRIFWAGDDPLLGGVRAEVEWSAAGESAVHGKTFRRFSPAFFAAGGRVTGVPVNMGGLVNRAAFTRIQPFFAKSPDESDASGASDASDPSPQPEPPDTPDPTPTMTDEEIKALQDENAALKNQLAEMQSQLDALTLQAKAAAESEAKTLVARAAAEGRIPPGEEIQAKWTAALVADPSARELLLAIAPHPALAAASIIKAKPADDQDTIKAKAADPLAEAIRAARESTKH